MALTEEQFQNAAKIIHCETAIIKAVYDVESSHSGYLPDGRVKILFEGHRFWKQLVRNHYDPDVFLKNHSEYSNVLYKVWAAKNYKGGAKEWDRLSQAIEVCKLLGADTEFALRSASYGSFQIMGENFLFCGYDSAQTMLSEYNLKGEAEQLDSFVRFVQHTKLDDELIAKNFSGFAAGYNGSAYKANNYDTKLSMSYLKYKV